MRLQLESTDEITEVNGVKCRVWRGVTGRGCDVIAFIHVVASRDDQDCSQFEQELQELPRPRELPLAQVLDARKAL